VLDAGTRPCEANGLASAVAAVSVPVDGERFEDGRLVGSSEASEEPVQAAGGPIAKLASCLSILDNIRMPGSGNTPTAATAAASPGPFSAASQLLGGSTAEGGGGGGSGRPTSRRLGGKLEPGCTLRVRKAWGRRKSEAP
jgi:hypothetical protein